MNTPFFRTIPILLIKNGELVKTIRFKKELYVGDPINAVRIFNEKEVDELVLLDISASKSMVGPDFSLIEKIASEAFMPVAYGGGVTCFEDAKKVFSLGIEKIVINSEFLSRPLLIREITDVYGVQSVVVSIDYKYNIFGKRKVYSHSRKKGVSKLSVEELIDVASKIGVAEVIVNSVTHDGMMCGADIEFVKSLKNCKVNIVPVGGIGSFEDIFSLKKIAGAKACGVGSKFVFQDVNRSVMINYLNAKEKEILDSK
ncbi:HisA/HisF-related TIM barrel protein [Shewanella algae]|uniref:HisA/HisF-related TIM barrel protein n=1 Tax=Shewanella algae TaxID=38313 RepID=UPI001AAE85CE|nr:HisA/HisF-related TIM barrel protein [Shewanella algae]MBO2581707.1 imidazole glycerol phosphate synthase subunit HisF [Shewanella algae]